MNRSLEPDYHISIDRFTKPGRMILSRIGLNQTEQFTDSFINQDLYCGPRAKVNESLHWFEERIA